jgi:hypothetical protein
MQTKVALHLNTLNCGAENEHGSEPYIWPIVIADETGIPQLHVPTTQWAAKVLVNEILAGQSVTIPPEMSLDLAHVLNDKAAGLIVLLVALFEKDSSPLHGSVAVLRHIEERSLAFVRDHLTECRQSSGERGDLRQMLVTRFDLAGAETDALNYLERLGVTVSPGGFDDSVGFTVWTLSGPALAPRYISFNLDSSSERFTLTGYIQLTDLPVSLCQAERDRLAQAEAVVKSLQTQRELLQTQLHHATPQQKPAIVAQITRLSEVDMPAAEAALTDAEVALKRCLDRFDHPHGPTESPAIR